MQVLSYAGSLKWVLKQIIAAKANFRSGFALV
jgi:hypothetical protein